MLEVADDISAVGFQRGEESRKEGAHPSEIMRDLFLAGASVLVSPSFVQGDGCG